MQSNTRYSFRYSQVNIIKTHPKQKVQIPQRSVIEDDSQIDQTILSHQKFNVSDIQDIEQIEYIATKQQVTESSTPKVAMLFLLTSHLPLEAVWRAFFFRAIHLSHKNRIHPPVIDDVKLNNLFNMLPELQRVDPPTNHLLGKEKQSTDGWEAKIKKSLSQPMDYTKHDRIQDYFQKNASRLLDLQELFNVYVHMNPGLYLPKQSIFAGREVPIRVEVQYTQHTLVLAELALTHEALKNPLNQKFILLSESCSPIYPPELIYTQLMFEDKSRVRACDSNTLDIDNYRRNELMETKYFKERNWHKSRQWFSLTRAHAKLVLGDKHVERLFNRYCFTTTKISFKEEKWQRNRLWQWICISDEHYVPSVLSTYDQGNQTSCSGNLVWSYWNTKEWSPVSFHNEDVNDLLIQQMKSCDKLCQQSKNWFPEQCKHQEALDSVNQYFDYTPNITDMVEAAFQDKNKTIDDLQHYKVSNKAPGNSIKQNQQNSHKNQNDVKHFYQNYKALGQHCPLFGRKFSADSIDNLKKVSLSCNGIGLDDLCYKQRYLE